MTQTSTPSPQLFFETAFAIQRTEAINAAIDLEIFTSIKEKNDTPSTLAKRCQASERGMRMLADYLVMLGFLTKSGNAYQLTPDSELFLVKNSPAYVGNTLEFILTPSMYNGFRQLTTAIRKGGTALDDKGTTAAMGHLRARDGPNDDWTSKMDSQPPRLGTWTSQKGPGYCGRAWRVWCGNSQTLS